MLKIHSYLLPEYLHEIQIKMYQPSQKLSSMTSNESQYICATLDTETVKTLTNVCSVLIVLLLVFSPCECVTAEWIIKLN